jgi:hypothetical protein
MEIKNIGVPLHGICSSENCKYCHLSTDFLRPFDRDIFTYVGNRVRLRFSIFKNW